MNNESTIARLTAHFTAQGMAADAMAAQIAYILAAKAARAG